ncbi:MAG: ATP-grasp domain-containing protein [Patescibacteria group bacterium]|nr:ATP-grasp domain-containing protein [Patescibacteria group bacterium]
MLLILKENRSIRKEANKTITILKKKLTNKGVQVATSNFEEFELFIEKDKVKAFIEKQPLEKYKVIFSRNVGKQKNLAFILSELCKKQNILYIDKLHSSINDATKLKQTVLLAINNLPVPKTYFTSIYDDVALETAEKFLGYPMVIKLSKSSLGLGVYLAKNKNEAKKIIKKNLANEIIIQEFIPNTFDYRILILGKTIGAIIKRERQTDEKEFRNNVYLGANETFLKQKEVDKKITKLALKSAKITNIQVAGVDIVVDKAGRPYVLEVNISPAFTFDEKISNEIESLSNYLYICHKKKRR